jgi:hypothetical protein
MEPKTVEPHLKELEEIIKLTMKKVPDSPYNIAISYENIPKYLSEYMKA